MSKPAAFDVEKVYFKLEGARADKEFAASGDVMLAIDWAARAAAVGAPLPPAIGAWLRKAFDDYREGTSQTMDSAMGLALKGKAQPRRRSREARELDDALATMYVLIVLGATREAAAELVAVRTDRQVEQLTRSYGKSDLAGREQGSGLARMPAKDRRNVVIRELANYPDDDRTRQQKAALRKLHNIDPL